MNRFNVTKSTSAATATTTRVIVSEVSQPDLAEGQHQQGSFVGRSTTVHTPESTYVQAADRDAGLKLLAEISALQPQIDPFQALATYQTVSLAENVQEQSARSLSLSDEPSLSNEPSQPTDDVDPIMVVEEPKPRSGQNQVYQAPDSIDQWITYSGDEIRPFKCGYEGCDKTYMSRRSLVRHCTAHTGSEYRCFVGECIGHIQYCDKRTLDRHIQNRHTFVRPYACKICSKRFARPDHLTRHKNEVHKKSFKCDICTKRFGHLDRLKDHKKHVHSIKD